MRLTKQFARIAAVGAAACVLNVCMPMQAFGLQTSGVIRVTGFESAKAVDSDSYDAMRQIVTAAWDSMEESADLTKLKIRRDETVDDGHACILFCRAQLSIFLFFFQRMHHKGVFYLQLHRG